MKAIYLGDLTFADEGNSEFKESGEENNFDVKLINFGKSLIISNITGEIRRLQAKPYTNIEQDPYISFYLQLNCTNLNEKEAFDRSLHIEPREK